MWLGTKEKPNSSSNMKLEFFGHFFYLINTLRGKLNWHVKKNRTFTFFTNEKKAKKSGAIFRRVWPKSIFKATSGSLGRHIIEACLQAITNLKGGNKSLSSQSWFNASPYLRGCLHCQKEILMKPNGFEKSYLWIMASKSPFHRFQIVKVISKHYIRIFSIRQDRITQYAPLWPKNPTFGMAVKTFLA